MNHCSDRPQQEVLKGSAPSWRPLQAHGHSWIVRDYKEPCACASKAADEAISRRFDLASCCRGRVRLVLLTRDHTRRERASRALPGKSQHRTRPRLPSRRRNNRDRRGHAHPARSDPRALFRLCGRSPPPRHRPYLRMAGWAQVCMTHWCTLLTRAHCPSVTSRLQATNCACVSAERAPCLRGANYVDLRALKALASAAAPLRLIGGDDPHRSRRELSLVLAASCSALHSLRYIPRIHGHLAPVLDRRGRLGLRALARLGLLRARDLSASVQSRQSTDLLAHTEGPLADDVVTLAALATRPDRSDPLAAVPGVDRIAHRVRRRPGGQAERSDRLGRHDEGWSGHARLEGRQCRRLDLNRSESAQSERATRLANALAHQTLNQSIGAERRHAKAVERPRLAEVAQRQ